MNDKILIYWEIFLNYWLYKKDLFFVVSWRKFQWILIEFMFIELIYYINMIIYIIIEVIFDYIISIQINYDFVTWKEENHWYLLSNNEIIDNKLWINTELYIH